PSEAAPSGRGRPAPARAAETASREAAPARPSSRPRRRARARERAAVPRRRRSSGAEPRPPPRSAPVAILPPSARGSTLPGDGSFREAGPLIPADNHEGASNQPERARSAAGLFVAPEQERHGKPPHA